MIIHPFFFNDIHTVQGPLKLEGYIRKYSRRNRIATLKQETSHKLYLGQKTGYVYEADNR